MKFLNSFQWTVAFALIVINIGCSKNNFPKYNQLGDLRVLALVVDQPEVSPGTAVNVTPILSDLNGAGRALSYSVQACIDPGIGIGATPSCATPDASNTRSGAVTIAAGSSQTYTGSTPSFAVTTPDSATILSYRNAADQFNGVSYLVIYTLTAPDGANVTSFVRVVVSAASKTTKNQNPAITSINMNGAATVSPSAMPTSSVNFGVISPASSSQTYQMMTASGAVVTRTEQLFSTWFISDGSFDSPRTYDALENTWTPPDAKPPSRGVVILVVTRDGNNGIAFKKLELN